MRFLDDLGSIIIITNATTGTGKFPNSDSCACSRKPHAPRQTPIPPLVIMNPKQRLWPWKKNALSFKPKQHRDTQFKTKADRNPLLLPEIAFAVCEYLANADLHSLCLSCRSLFHPAVRRLWRHIRIRDNEKLLRLERTLARNDTSSADYPAFVHVFECHFHVQAKDFKHFLFPNLCSALIFPPYLAPSAPIATYFPMLHLACPNLVDVVCRSSMSQDFERCLLDIPHNQLRTLGMWGSSPFVGLGAVVRNHRVSLRRVQLNRADAVVLLALTECTELREIIYNTDPPFWDSDRDALTAFCTAPAVAKLTRLCSRNWFDLQDRHLAAVARTSGVNLVCVRLLGSPRFRDSFKVLAHHCPNLEILDADAMEQSDLEDIITRCRRLKELHVQNNIFWAINCLRPLIDLPPYTHTLEVLNLRRFNIDSHFARRLLMELPRLSQFTPGEGCSQSDVNWLVKSLKKKMGREAFRVGPLGVTIFRIGTKGRFFDWDAPWIE
ncbi:hypothetical protein BC938DRAFT_473865 [Jimgerdemannia flammicorona]|uniref:F-box domain-containing protein n=1 Tax=Jimgerdemannia flammicorona TaxID=994334 RepID=A0A433Q383_9FUNG|nr:hypothetical protein BC938DRAFT_473865 [Jimgerdemannia flammicorona]